MHIFHKWHLWSEPINREYQLNDRLSGKVLTVEGQIQERRCATCGKYQWRKV